MSADLEKKATTEKALVAGLLILFVFTFVGSLKNMGILSFGSAKSGTVVTSKSIADQQLSSGDIGHAVVDIELGDRVEGSLFAHLERDPFENYLPAEIHPEPVVQQVIQEVEPAEKLRTVVEVQRSALPQWNVSGIVWGGSNPQAIVDNLVVRIGDRIAGGAEILAIDRGGITVSYQGETANVSVVAPGGRPNIQARANRR